MNDDGPMVGQDVDAVERGAMDKLPMIRRLAAEIKEQAADTVIRILVGRQNGYLGLEIRLVNTQCLADARVAAAHDEQARHRAMFRGFALARITSCSTAGDPERCIREEGSRPVFCTLLAQIPQLGLQRHAVDLVDGQGEERADASGNLEVHVGEGLELTRTIPDNRGWIGETPMGGDGLTRPCGTGLASRLIADCENEIHRRRIRRRKLRPALAAQTAKVIVLTGEHFKRERMHFAARMATRAVRLEPISAEMVQDDFRHDAARGIAGADEQGVVDFGGHVRLSR